MEPKWVRVQKVGQPIHLHVEGFQKELSEILGGVSELKAMQEDSTGTILHEVKTYIRDRIITDNLTPIIGKLDALLIHKPQRIVSELDLDKRKSTQEVDEETTKKLKSELPEVQNKYILEELRRISDKIDMMLKIVSSQPPSEEYSGMLSMPNGLKILQKMPEIREEVIEAINQQLQAISETEIPRKKYIEIIEETPESSIGQETKTKIKNEIKRQTENENLQSEA